MAKAKDAPDPVMDVSRPGKNPPADKSVIVPRRSVIKDPSTRVEVKHEDDEPAAKPMARSSTRNVIKPLSEAAQENPSKETTDSSETKEKGSSTPTDASKKEEPAEGKTISQLAEEAAARKKSGADPSAPPAKETKPEPQADSKPDPSDVESKPDEKTSDDEISTPENEKNKNAIKATTDEAEQSHQEAIQKLIDSKKYALPITTAENRRSKRVVMLGVMLSVVLAAAWANIALDACLISVPGVEPLTDFF